MQRLAVPRPRLHLTQFHGVLAPKAKLRPKVEPQEPADTEQTTEPTAAVEREIDGRAVGRRHRGVQPPLRWPDAGGARRRSGPQRFGRSITPLQCRRDCAVALGDSRCALGRCAIHALADAQLLKAAREPARTRMLRGALGYYGARISQRARNTAMGRCRVALPAPYTGPIFSRFGACMSRTI